MDKSLFLVTYVTFQIITRRFCVVFFTSQQPVDYFLLTSKEICLQDPTVETELHLGRK